MKRKMKDIILVIVIMFVLIVGLFAGCKFEQTYKRLNCEIVSIENDTVTVKDTTNNFWSFKGDGFTVGDTVTLEMDTNRTDNIIIDDKVIKVIKE